MTNSLARLPDSGHGTYKQLLAIEAGWRDMKGSLGLRPVHHHREGRIRSHIQLCWLALLIRIIENTTYDTRRSTRHELDRMHLVTLATPHGHVAQRSQITPSQRGIPTAIRRPADGLVGTGRVRSGR